MGDTINRDEIAAGETSVKTAGSCIFLYFALVNSVSLYYNTYIIDALMGVRTIGPVRQCAVNHVRRGTEQH